MRTQSIDAIPAKDGVSRASSRSTNLVHTIGSEAKDEEWGSVDPVGTYANPPVFPAKR